MLRAYGVVGAFVEFAGDGLASLALADRATISNMSPEFGATATIFPIDDETLTYLRMTARPDDLVNLVERYAKEQGLWREPGADTQFDALLELDLGTVDPSVAGPRRPQDRVPLTDLKANFRSNFPNGLTDVPSAPQQEERFEDEGGVTDVRSLPADQAIAAIERQAPDPTTPEGDEALARGTHEEHRPHAQEYTVTPIEIDGQRFDLRSGSVAIAAITSCTNTSNPTVMVGAGLVARNAVARGLRVAPTVKTSLAPGSKAVTTYLASAGLMAPLEDLGFALAGYGCTTCIGNSGPLDEPIARAIEDNDLVVAAVLSGNRNFEGRIHPLARASYLASPPLVVAFALAGRVDIDLTREPLGRDRNGTPVYLADLWPSPEEIKRVIGESIDPEVFRSTYRVVFEGDHRWKALPIPSGDRYLWDASSTYIAKPPFFDGLSAVIPPVTDIENARVLAVLGDSVTTDHISPAGSIAPSSPAGQWLQAHGVAPLEFNSYGARRGHHEVMMRGTFANIRLRNRLTPEREGPYTLHLPDAEQMFIYDASVKYRAEGVPLIVIAGREYGSGSSRDWAAKGPMLLGVRAVIAESFERIHRSNLVGMGVLPLQFAPGESAASLGLTGRESYTIHGLADGLRPRSHITVVARDDETGAERRFGVISRLDGAIEVDYYRNGGILPAVLRRVARESAVH
jgi:aconitate hydratase